MNPPRLVSSLLVASALTFVCTLSSCDKQLSPSEGFLKLYRLTPEELRSECGSSKFYYEGFLAKNDDSRDFHYIDRFHRDIVFRFTGDDDHGWHSLGVWDNVKWPSVGNEIAVSDVFSRMPCLGTLAASRSLQPSIRSHNPTLVLASFREALPQVEPIHVDNLSLDPIKPIQPLPNEGVPSTATNVGVSSSINVGGGNNGVSFGSSSGGGSGGGQETARTIVAPCIDDDDINPCNIVDAAKFVSEFEQAITAAKRGRMDVLTDWLARSIGRNVKIVQLPSLEVDRAKVIQAIFRLEFQSINLVAQNMRSGVDRLVPFDWDSAQEKEKKLAAAQAGEQTRTSKWKSAAEETGSSSLALSGSNHGHLIVKTGRAYRDLQNVHISASRFDSN